MLTTQQFADLCDTTKKTIIHYDRIDLIKPNKYHGRNRLYLPKQVLIFQKINLLKSFGMTLTEIKKYLHRDYDLLNLFIKKQRILEEQKIILEKRIDKAKEFIVNLKTGKTMIAPKINIIKPYTIYAMERDGRYVDIKKHQQELFSLIGDIQCQQVGMTIFKEDYYSPHQSRMIAGAVIKDKNPKKIKGVHLIKFPSCKAVSYVHIGPYSYMSFIWQFMDKFVKENNLKRNPDLPTREFYIRGSLVEPIEENCITELQIPITSS